MPGVSEDQHEGMRWNAVSKRAEQAVRTEFTGAQWYWTSRLLSGFFFSLLWMKWEPWDGFEQN